MKQPTWPLGAYLSEALDEAAIIAITDPTGRIVYCNEKFSEVSGYEQAELLGRTHRVINSGTHPKTFFADMFAVISRGGVWRGTICNRKKSGELYWVDTTIVPAIGDDGRTTSYTSIRFDVTAHIRALEAVREARAETDRVSAYRDRILSNLSHEVRTPLNGVLGLASALSKTSLKPGQLEMLALLTRSGEQLLALLDDLLKASQLHGSDLSVTAGLLDLATTLSAVIEPMRSAAEARGTGLDCRIAGDAAPFVVTDPGHLKVILRHLLGNAVKFSAGGQIGVHAATRNWRRGLRLRLMVTDQGIGFDRALAQKIFEPFTQGDDAIDRRYGGAGLGLSIAYSLTRLLGGSLRARSTPGKGSVFCVSIPVEVAGSPSMRTPEATAAGGERPRILVVDDHSMNQMVVRCLLEPAGFDVITADNGAEALVQLGRDNSVDAVLMDMQMPIMDGLTAIRKIRADEPPATHLPIAMLTANTTEAQIASSLAAGADFVIAKPVNAGALMEGLDLLLDARRRTETPQSGAPAPQSGVM